jgi:hypothetical protein
VPLVYLRFAPSRQSLDKHDVVAGDEQRVPVGAQKP